MKKTYFNHDSSARMDYRIIKLRASLGYEGYGIFWALLEMLFTEENKICKSQYDILAFGLQCDTEKLRAVIEDYDLFVIEDNCFYSRRLNNQIEQINNKSQKAKESAEKRWSNTKVMQSHNDSSASKVDKIKVKQKKSTLESRYSSFKQQVLNTDIKMSTEEKGQFIDYWTEPNKSNTKMRFELEKTWHLSRRINRWVKNNFSSSSKSKFPEYYDEYTYKRLDNKGQQDYIKHLKELGFETVYSPTAGTVWRKKHTI